MVRCLFPLVLAASTAHGAALMRFPSSACRAAAGSACRAARPVVMSEEEALVSALGRVSEKRGSVVVVKYGGHAMTNDERAAEFASDMAMLQSLGLRPVVVHGGGAREPPPAAQASPLSRSTDPSTEPRGVDPAGPQIGAMLKRLEIQSEFIDGLRVTDPATMEVVEMVLCGVLNKKIASAINSAGGRAVGLSGKDDSLVVASKKGHTMTDPETGESVEVDLGLVGAPQTVRTPLLEQLLDGGIIPVIAPVRRQGPLPSRHHPARRRRRHSSLAYVSKRPVRAPYWRWPAWQVATGDGGASYNVNADTMAGVVASALKADSLLLLTDVAGVLDGDMELIRSLTAAEAQGLCDDGTASGAPWQTPLVLAARRSAVTAPVERHAWKVAGALAEVCK